MRFVLSFLAAAALAGPAWAQGVKVDVPPPVPVAPLPNGAKPKPVSLTRMSANIPPGTPWAAEFVVPVPLPCSVDPDVYRWKEGDNRIDDLAPWERVFRQELANLGFPSSGDPTNLFEEQQAGDLQVGALITDLRAHFCLQETPISNLVGGKAVMSVEWQIYSVVQGKVVARIATRGGVDLKPRQSQSSNQVLTGAFGDNARRLVADGRFRELVLSTGTTAPPPLTPMRLELAAPTKRVPLAVAADSVVAVFAGESHGSGMVVTPDGYILTNHHVAGSAGQVRVRWPDGSESIGDVVRADSRRDIALIKTTPKATALALRQTPAALGEPVYAIGTPLDAKFQGSVTKGIVSANRVYEGLPYIQSDVVINGGNSGGPLLDENGAVIGICVSGWEINGAPVGINLFIPIDDALKALALLPASGATPTAAGRP